MKVSLKDLWETSGALDQLAVIEFEDEALCYRLGRIQQAVAGHIKALQRSQAKLLRKYGKEQIVAETGKPAGTYYIPIGTDEEDQFLAEWDKLTAEEIQILPEVDYQPFTLKQLREGMGRVDDESDSAFKKLPLRPVILGALARWLIVEDGAAKPKKLKAVSGD